MARKQAASGARRGATKSRSGIPAGDDVVFVGGIPREATQSDLRTLFQNAIGGVKKVRFVIDHSTRHHKGFGFARFESAEFARKAVTLAKVGIFTHGKMLNIGGSFEVESDESSGTCGLSSANSDSECAQNDGAPDLLDAEVPDLVDATPLPAVPLMQMMPQAFAVPQQQQQQQPVFVMQQPQVQPQVMQFRPVVNYIVTPQGLCPTVSYPQVMPMQH